MPELTHAQARAFYDRFGSRQDLQRLYEDAALERLLANAALRQAHAVVEFGCGTGRLAERMLDGLLPLDATYLGYDVSLTMVELARARLARFGPRACVAQTDGSPVLPLADSTCDRFVSTYVFDLLSSADTRAVVEEAQRILVTDGRLCLASLAPGAGPFSRMIQALWKLTWRLRPQLVGGCQPVELTALIGPHWRILYREVICRLGLCSEVLIARPTRVADRSNTNYPSACG